MKKNLFILLASISIYFHIYPVSKKAFVIVPVANAVGQAFVDHHSLENEYNKIPASYGPKKTDKVTCPRLHQLLFNEVVTIVKELPDGQVLVRLKNMFYIDSATQQENNLCWTLSKYLVSFDTLHDPHLYLKYIPQPFSHKKNEDSNILTITLKLPFFDPVTHHTYSAGTRFIAQQTQESYLAYIYDERVKNFKKIAISKKFCAAVTYANRNAQIAAFVDLLKTWSHLSNGYIPLVWGGVSFAKIYKTIEYTLKEKKGDHPGFFWLLKNEEYPLSGFDSSGLILRAAQICQIPYYFKNTTTAKKRMQPIDNIHELKNGDLLWIPGALFVVSNRDKNMLISALSYQDGYGSVFEKQVKDLFVDIETVEELFDAMQHNKQIYIKNGDGSVSNRTVTHLAFLSIRSVWND